MRGVEFASRMFSGKAEATDKEEGPGKEAEREYLTCTVCSQIQQEPDLTLIAIAFKARLDLPFKKDTPVPAPAPAAAPAAADEPEEDKSFENSVKSQSLERDLLATCRDLRFLAAGPCVCHLYDRSGGETPQALILNKAKQASAPLLVKALTQAASWLQGLTHHLCGLPASKFTTAGGSNDPLLGLLNCSIDALIQFSDLLSLQSTPSRNEQSDKSVINLITTYSSLIDRHRPIFSKTYNASGQLLEEASIDHEQFSSKARQVAPPLVTAIVNQLIMPYVGERVMTPALSAKDNGPLEKSLKDAIHAARTLLWASISAAGYSGPVSAFVDDLCLRLGPAIACINSSLKLLPFGQQFRKVCAGSEASSTLTECVVDPRETELNELTSFLTMYPGGRQGIGERMYWPVGRLMFAGHYECYQGRSQMDESGNAYSNCWFAHLPMDCVKKIYSCACKAPGTFDVTSYDLPKQLPWCVTPDYALVWAWLYERTSSGDVLREGCSISVNASEAGGWISPEKPDKDVVKKTLKAEVVPVVVKKRIIDPQDAPIIQRQASEILADRDLITQIEARTTLDLSENKTQDEAALVEADVAEQRKLFVAEQEGKVAKQQADEQARLLAIAMNPPPDDETPVQSVEVHDSGMNVDYDDSLDSVQRIMAKVPGASREMVEDALVDNDGDEDDALMDVTLAMEEGS